MRALNFFAQKPATLPLRRLVATRAAKGASAKYEDILKGTDPENREALVRILEKAERAADRWGTDSSDFAYPPVCQDALLALSRISGVAGGFVWGGYPSAERCRVVVGHPDVIATLKDAPQESESVAAVSITGNFLFDAATHRDFLGAAMGTGIVRDRIGDIVVVGDKGAQIVTTPELVEHFVTNLKQVRSVPVECTPIPLSELKVQPPKTKDLTSHEASLRVDAIASAGFQMSRSKMADMIQSGDLKVNWKQISKKDYEVKAGDVLSVRGKGRCVIVSVDATKNDRFRVNMQRLV